MPDHIFHVINDTLSFLSTPVLLAILGYLIYMSRKLGEFNIRLSHLEEIHKTNNPGEGGEYAANTEPASQLEPNL